MRIMNDSKPEEQSPRQEFSLLVAAGYGLLSGVAISTFFLGPLPVILAHLRLPQPWPKGVALLGAVLALVAFQAPMIPVALVFVASLVVADSVSEDRNFWGCLVRVVPVAAGMGILGLILLGLSKGIDPLAYWELLTGRIVDELQRTVQVPKGFDWPAVQNILQWEGPFLYLSGVVLSAWLSVGLAAHMGWIDKDHPCGSKGLRALRLPAPICWAGAAGFAALALLGSPTGLFSGAVRLLGALLFVQGAVCLSVVMHQRGAAPRLRTLVYLAAVSLGFYALVGLGVVSPWFFRKRAALPLNKELEEGV